MKIEFDEAHKIAHGRQYEGRISPYSNYYNLPTFSQLAVCITGTPDYILGKLKKMVFEMENEAKKPLQGKLVSNNASIAEIITPVWEGVVIKSLDKMDPKNDEDEDCFPPIDGGMNVAQYEVATQDGPQELYEVRGTQGLEGAPQEA